MTAYSEQAQPAAPLELPRLDLAVRRRADGKVLAAAALVGLLFDLAVRSGVVGVAGAATVLSAAAALVATKRAATTQAKALAAAAAVFGAFLAVRTSDWLTLPNLAAATLLLALAAAAANDDRPRADLFDLTIPAATLRLVTAALHVFAAPAFLATARPHDGTRRIPRAAVRGLLALAAPLVAALAALLASADAVFASLFRLPSSPAQLALHIFLIAVGAWGMAGLLRTASSAPAPAPITPVAKRMTRTEANVVLAALVALFAAFAVTQLIAATGGARHVLQQQGLTYAEYARSGFFQLLAVAAITMAVLLALNALTEVARSTLVLAQAAIALTLVIVGVALYRLDLYEQAFGLTMLRLYSQVAAVWIALVFILLGAALAGLHPQRRWLPSAAAATAFAFLLALNLANPEAVVVKRNAARHPATTVDAAYLNTLSDDAVPALHKAALLSQAACNQPRPKGWAAANWSRAKANGVRNRPGVCHP